VAASLRDLRVRVFRVWSSAPDDPRLRRPTDVLLLIASGLAALGIGLYLHNSTPPTSGPSSSGSLAELVQWMAEFFYALVAVWAAALVVLALASRGRRRLVWDFLLGALLAIGTGLLVARPASGGWTETLQQSLTADPSPVDVLAPLAICAAIIVIASPHLAQPLRWAGRCLIVLGGTAALLLEIVAPIGSVTAVVCGIVAGSLAHLILGTPSGHRTAEQVAEALPDLGVSVVWTDLAPSQEAGYSAFNAIDDEGRDLAVKVYGRDAWDAQFVSSFWTALTMKGETVEIVAGRRSQVEREAMMTLLAERGGVCVLPVRAAGLTDDGDAVLVTEAAAHPLSELSDADLTDERLAQLWATLGTLHGLGFAHRDIDARSIVLRQDDRMALTNLVDARIDTDGSGAMIDRARMLVETALLVGRDRAVSSAVTALGHDDLVQMLPYVQKPVLDSETRDRIDEQEWSVDDLRSAVVAATGADEPELERLQRVTVKSIAIVVLVGVMAYTLIGMLTKVNFSEVWADLQGADKKWLLLALLLSPLVQGFLSFSTLGATLERLRYVAVLMLQYAIQFIGLTLPSTAARLALEIRFFQKFGVPAGGAISIGMIDSFSGFLVQIVLIVVILVSGLPGFTSPIRSSSSTSDSSSSTSSGPSALLILTVVLIVVGLLATVFVPRARRRMAQRISKARDVLREQASVARSALGVVRHPAKLLTMLFGNFGAQVLQAIILGVCLVAFGQSAHLSQLILINTLVSLFGGLMPVPGSMGVAEAGYTAGLVAIGVPSSVAISVAIAFRLVTFYLPPIWGSFAMRWLHQRDYV
jgi:uncharacterized protein (TIRG00374 family)